MPNDFMTRLARAAIPHAVLEYLRGDFKSIRYRFIEHPKEYARLLLHRTKGGDYFTWYANRLDGFAESRQVSMSDKDRTRQDAYMQTGTEDRDWLIRLGLLPHHRLHEFGMGFGRTAQHLITYLSPGKYSGNDASSGRIDEGRQYLQSRSFDFKDSSWIVNPDNSFDWLNGEKVDYIWCHAVIPHMPRKDIRNMFANMRKIMHDESKAIITYTHNPGRKAEFRRSVKDWYHHFSFFEPLCADLGLKVCETPVMEHKNYHPLTRCLVITLDRKA